MRRIGVGRSVIHRDPGTLKWSEFLIQPWQSGYTGKCYQNMLDFIFSIVDYCQNIPLIPVTYSDNTLAYKRYLASPKWPDDFISNPSNLLDSLQIFEKTKTYLLPRESTDRPTLLSEILIFLVKSYVLPMHNKKFLFTLQHNAGRFWFLCNKRHEST